MSNNRRIASGDRRDVHGEMDSQGFLKPYSGGHVFAKGKLRNESITKADSSYIGWIFDNVELSQLERALIQKVLNSKAT